MQKPEGYTGPFDGVRSNSQPIKKPVKGDKGLHLDVVDIFHTIQGEGPYCGRPAVFVRLANCNLQCPMCDTEYTTNIQQFAVPTIGALVKDAHGEHPTNLVVITGGEPFRQNIALLCDVLMGLGYDVQIETNGTLPPSAGMNFGPTKFGQTTIIVCSPKTGRINEELASRVHSYKYVLSADAVAADGLPSSVLGLPNPPARPSRDPQGNFIRPVYIQPADHQNEMANAANMEAAVKSAMENGYILQLQIHKFLGLD